MKRMHEKEKQSQQLYRITEETKTEYTTTLERDTNRISQ